jgi:hypothetical protein
MPFGLPFGLAGLLGCSAQRIRRPSIQSSPA